MAQDPLRESGWRWANFPIPEPFVIPLALGILLHLVRPLRIFANPWIGRATGLPLLAAGIAISAWAVNTVGGMKISKPTTILSIGPYRLSRNPMYVGWAIIYAGIALAANAAWALILYPVALLATHLVVLGEERALERRFGEEYPGYRARVRRYF